MEYLPDPIIYLIVGSPTLKPLVKIFNKINGNSASIQMKIGGKNLSYLALTVTPTIYETLYSTAFYLPANPRAAPSYPSNVTSIKNRPSDTSLTRRFPISSTQQFRQDVETTDPRERRKNIHARSQGEIRGVW